jgi:hypothetical protein
MVDGDFGNEEGLNNGRAGLNCENDSSSDITDQQIQYQNPN